MAVNRTLLAVSLTLLTGIANAQTLKIDYEGFTVWEDCDRRGAIRFEYKTGKDAGSQPRLENFTFDRKVPKTCQQISTNSYGHGYDRGHLVPANHLDYSYEAIKQTNNITNILPQTATMNRGAWLATEEVIECYRDEVGLNVIGGVIWGNNPNDDFFLRSHGVKTPDAFWKVVTREDTGKTIAWIVPNTNDAARARLDSYTVSVSQIEKITGENIPVAQGEKDRVSAPWELPKTCNKG